MRVSVELVPRDEDALLRDARLLRELFPRVSQVNIPDLFRFPLRSWDACALTRKHFPVSVPHIRAIDKFDAGANGLFTQPFFDLRLLQIHVEILAGKTVFWGIAPVLTEKSCAYWEATNRTFFPNGFTPTLEWNQDFARRALKVLETSGGHVYFMPIRLDIGRYLSGVL